MTDQPNSAHPKDQAAPEENASRKPEDPSLVANAATEGISSPGFEGSEDTLNKDDLGAGFVPPVEKSTDERVSPQPGPFQESDPQQEQLPAEPSLTGAAESATGAAEQEFTEQKPSRLDEPEPEVSQEVPSEEEHPRQEAQQQDATQNPGKQTPHETGDPSQAATDIGSTTTALVPVVSKSPAIIESASATTSPDNVNSGYISYVITIMALVGILLLSMGLWSCTSSLVESGLRSGLGSLAQQWGEDESGSSPYGSNGGDSSNSRGGSTGSSLSVSDALDLNLDLYSDTISSNISASDYAGTPNSMRSYVLSIVHTDSDHNSTVVAHLNAASASDDPRSEVEAAITECDTAISDLNAVELPSDLSSDISQNAQTGREKAIARWQAIQEELKLFDTQDEVSYSDLQKADNEVAEATSDAGIALVEALTSAAAAR